MGQEGAAATHSSQCGGGGGGGELSRSQRPWIPARRRPWRRRRPQLQPAFRLRPAEAAQWPGRRTWSGDRGRGLAAWKTGRAVGARRAARRAVGAGGKDWQAVEELGLRAVREGREPRGPDGETLGIEVGRRGPLRRRVGRASEAEGGACTRVRGTKNSYKDGRRFQKGPRGD